ncbi:MAG: chemotaxis protein CheA [Clostridiales bacterium]|jgi:two-component system chemotaxis sensor kinase CheA|nr:chemotaxis protein CheA [Clostridiales bacterium]
MSQDNSLLEVYIYENTQLLEQLDGILLTADKSDRFTADQVASIFRILHTIKGSSAMMEFDRMAKLSHAMEDLFGYIRDNIDSAYNHREICDMVFAAEDFLTSEIETLQDGQMPTGEPGALLDRINACYNALKGGAMSNSHETPTPNIAFNDELQAALNMLDGNPAIKSGSRHYKAVIHFEKDCKMENIRAFGVLKSIENLYTRITTVPEDVLKDDGADEIVANGFTMFIESDTPSETLKEKIAGNILIEQLTFEPMEELTNTPLDRRASKETAPNAPKEAAPAPQQKHNYMSVRLDKLDKLLDLVGEIVITESTVTKNPDIVGLHLENFSKAARQLRKLTDELQDTVMSIRMIPISATFHKLERIVRDMCKKIDKEANLVIIGEDTEMDKNVIDNLSDPLMHIIRNSMDHGIEHPDIREQSGKNRAGAITIEARNTGGDVLITVSDDGKGLDREQLIAKGIERGLIKKPPPEITDKEAYALICTPGFSTNEQVTEFSGRGVGMDVVTKNIQKMGGSISVDSTMGEGMKVTLRIPLTLAIIDGMQVRVGDCVFIVPLLNIRESFKPAHGDVFTDPDGNELILIRENCYSVLRLYKLLGIESAVANFEDGILVLIDSDSESYCLLVDQLLGEQQTVIKPMPLYISRSADWLQGIAGCTILGNGDISLILDINNLLRG